MKDLRKKVVGVFSYPWSDIYDKKTPIEIYRRAVWFKANPRNKDYMKALFFTRYPEGVFVDADKDAAWNKNISSAEKIIMLYPDTIGMGFLNIDSEVFRCKEKTSAVCVLNGRKREFLLNDGVRAKLYLRRFTERYMLGEILMSLIFLVLTPFFLLVDLDRRRL